MRPSSSSRYVVDPEPMEALDSAELPASIVPHPVNPFRRVASGKAARLSGGVRLAIEEYQLSAQTSARSYLTPGGGRTPVGLRSAANSSDPTPLSRSPSRSRAVSGTKGELSRDASRPAPPGSDGAVGFPRPVSRQGSSRPVTPAIAEGKPLHEPHLRLPIPKGALLSSAGPTPKGSVRFIDTVTQSKTHSLAASSAREELPTAHTDIVDGGDGEVKDGASALDDVTRPSSGAARSLTCIECMEDLPRESFTDYQIRRMDPDLRVCIPCTKKRCKIRCENDRADKSKTACTSIYIACRLKNMDYVLKAIDEGTSVTWKHHMTGRTALMEAAAVGDEDMCELLIEQGASVTAYSLTAQETALHMATECDSVVLIDMLLLAGAKVGAENRLGRQPIHNCHSVEAVKRLVKGGATDNVKDRRGVMPLFLSKERGDVEVYECLREMGLRRKVKEAKLEKARLEQQRELDRIADERRAKLTAIKMDKRMDNFKKRMRRDYLKWRVPGRPMTPEKKKTYNFWET